MVEEGGEVGREQGGETTRAEEGSGTREEEEEEEGKERGRLLTAPGRTMANSVICSNTS